MSNDTVGKIGWASSFGIPNTHVCNCIGCCEKCGGCRTDPRHTADVCGKIAALQAERGRILGG